MSVEIVSYQEAKRVRKELGKLTTSRTETKESAVAMINELYGMIVSNRIEVKDYSIPSIPPTSTYTGWVDFIHLGYIIGVVLSGNNESMNMRLKLFSKPKSSGGQIVYDSGDMTNTIWDVFTAPYIDESGQNKLWVELENKSSEATAYSLKIYCKISDY